jgi:hypothetical protein
MVALESWWDLLACLDLGDWVCARFARQAVYTEIAGVPEIRNRRNREQGGRAGPLILGGP